MVNRPEADAYRLVHMGKLEDMMNKGRSEHASAYPRCKGRLIFNFPAEEQRGVCTRQQLKCNTCNYKSNKHNLYTETDTDTHTHRGRRSAQPNITLHVGLTKLPISTTRTLHCVTSPRPPHLGSMLATLGQLTEFRVAYNGNRGTVTLIFGAGGIGREGRSHGQGGSKPTAQLPAAVPSFVPPPAQPGASRVDQSRWLNDRERSRLATGTQLLQPGRPGRGLGKSTLLLRPYLGRQ